MDLSDICFGTHINTYKVYYMYSFKFSKSYIIYNSTKKNVEI